MDDVALFYETNIELHRFYDDMRCRDFMKYFTDKYVSSKKIIAIVLFGFLILSFSGCDMLSTADGGQTTTSQKSVEASKEETSELDSNSTTQSETVVDETTQGTEDQTNALEQTSESTKEITQEVVDVDQIPDYSGNPYIELNDNKPAFEEQDISTKEFETYSSLDELGRCGVAFANISKDTMPTEERGKIGMIKPSGWNTIKYSFVDGRYLYNRCHLIGFQLAGENANEKNLITGTRYLNNNGMLPFENRVANYVERTANHVLYRVTPLYDGENLVADGVQMEGYSVEDAGRGICFNVFVYNCQPGVVIDYKNGDSKQSDTVKEDLLAAGLDDYNDVLAQKQATQNGSKTNDNIAQDETAKPSDSQNETQKDQNDDVVTQNTCDYIINTNTKRFHYKSCSSTKTMKEKNTLRFTGTRDEVIAKGYVPCKNCNP